MTMFRKLPITMEAVQFTGDNWDEMHAFTGHRELEGQTATSDGRPAYADVFNEMGTYLLKFTPDDAKFVGELWVEANQAWLPIEIGEWVLKDSIGFHPCKNEIFVKNYVSDEDFDMLFKGLDEDLTIPVLDGLADDSRMLGRVRMALIMTRPLSEADAICDRLLEWHLDSRMFQDVHRG